VGYSLCGVPRGYCQSQDVSELQRSGGHGGRLAGFVSSAAGLDLQQICSIGPGIAKLTEDCVELLAVDRAPWYSGP
jgi:hypothetical protein